jgi:exonuclease V gamma subunit
MTGLDVLTGLRVHRSNRVEVLASLLAAWIKERHIEGAVDPMQPDLVVVGNRGTERWLSHRLAEAGTRWPGSRILTSS